MRDVLSFEEATEFLGIGKTLLLDRKKGARMRGSQGLVVEQEDGKER